MKEYRFLVWLWCCLIFGYLNNDTMKDVVFRVGFVFALSEVIYRLSE